MISKRESVFLPWYEPSVDEPDKCETCTGCGSCGRPEKTDAKEETN